MALNKKLIILSGVGLVFAGAGAGVIGYKAVQVADGQKQMDDSKASMGGQLSFGLASPMATIAGTAGPDFIANIGTQIAADAAKGHIGYVNLSDQIQGDLITGIAHTVNMADPTKPADTKVGDPQAALAGVLDNLIPAKAKPFYKADDFEIPNLKAADIRRLINNDLSDERILELFSSSPTYKMTALGTITKVTTDTTTALTKAGKKPAEIKAGVEANVAKAITTLNTKTLKDAKATLKSVVESISKATVISLNVGIEDIIEAASGGVDFTTLVMNQFNPAAKATDPNLMTLMGGLQNGGNAVMESAINAVGNLNGALSAIRRLNPTAKIALGQLGTYGIPAIDAQLAQINSALMVAAFTQDIKSGDIMVAPIDPKGKLFPNPASPTDANTNLSLQDMYGKDPIHVGIGAKFTVMMFEAQAPKGFPQFLYATNNATDDLAKATLVTRIQTDPAFKAQMTVAAFEADPQGGQIAPVIYAVAKATTDETKATAIAKFQADKEFKAEVMKAAAAAQAAAQAAAGKTAGTGGTP